MSAPEKSAVQGIVLMILAMAAFAVADTFVKITAKIQVDDTSLERSINTAENVIDNIKNGADQICYMQMADSPDRYEPGTGEMDYAQILRASREAGYARPFGLELWAKDDNYDAALGAVIKLNQSL